VLYFQLIILSVEDDVSVDSEILLVTDFVNLKIKSAQSFKYANRGRVYIHVSIDMSTRMYISINVTSPSTARHS
jgi:hypothetical protein